MKNLKFPLIIIALVLFLSVSSFAQITSISQLKDVTPTDNYYADLQSLIEKYGAIGSTDDLDFAAEDVTPRPSKSEIGRNYFPQTALSNRQFAVILNAGANRLNELIAVEDQQIQASKMSETEKNNLSSTLLTYSVNSTPLNGLEISSTSQAKGLPPTLKEFEAMQRLIEEYGFGRDLLNSDGVYNPNKTYSEQELTDILNNAFYIQPTCGKDGFKVGELTLNYQNKVVNRARFAQILNQYFNFFAARLTQIATEFRDVKEFNDDRQIELLQNIVCTMKQVNAEPILFTSGSADISPVILSMLTRQSELLKHLPHTTIVEIGVFTDKTGTAAGADKLTQARAEKIRQELIKLGVNPDVLKAKGYGSSKPIADDSRPEGRIKNRRVEFSILKM